MPRQGNPGYKRCSERREDALIETYYAAALAAIFGAAVGAAAVAARKSPGTPKGL